MKRAGVHRNDFIDDHGYFAREVEKMGGKFCKVEYKANGNKVNYFLFENSLIGFVFKMGNRLLFDWEKDYLNKLEEEEVPCFIIRYWRDRNKLSLSEYGYGEGIPFVSGNIDRILSVLKDYANG